MTRSDGVGDIRETILGTAVVSGVLVTAVTEGLSAFGALTRGSLLVAWAVVGIAALIVASRELAAGRLRFRSTSLSPLDLAMGAWIVLVGLLTWITALLAVPTNTDSMAYHLARVAHWTQNQSVAFYPTQIIYQLYHPPWAEFAVLQLYLLAGSDRLVNLAQWLSMIGSVIGASLIARQLGATVRGQILAAFACATIPMGILQASSTQNDYVAAFWLVCLVHALLALESQPGALVVPSAGASLGLSVLTKGTAYIFALPFLMVFFVAARRPLVLKCKQGLVILLCAGALNAPQYVRNLELFGSVVGPGREQSGEFGHLNSEFSPAIFASNVLRSVGLHLGTPWRGVNTFTEGAIVRAHSLAGIGADDVRNTQPNTRFSVTPPVAHEDLAGNGVHLLLIIGAALAAWASRAETTGSRLKGYAGCLALASVLFCVLLRWTPWHSRLQLPLFVLGAPLVGAVFQRLGAKVGCATASTILPALTLLVLSGSSCFFLIWNETRPLTGPRSILSMTRADQWVAQTRLAQPAFLGAAQFLRSIGCVQLGLAMGGYDPEYLLWASLPEVRRGGRIEHVFVANLSGWLTDRRGVVFRPCALIRVWDAPRVALRVGGQSYRSAWSEGNVQVFIPSAVKEDRGSAATEGPPMTRLTLNGTRFRPEERVTVGLEVRNPRDSVAADLYVAVLLPDGRSASFVSGAGTMSGVTSLATPAAFARAEAARPGFALTDPSFFSFAFPKGVATGRYQVFAALVREGAFRSDRHRPQDILASDIQELVFSP